MARAGVIDARLRDAALAERLEPRAGSGPAAMAFVERKGANLVRSRLTTLLNVPALYDLDRLDLTAYSTLDAPGQEAASRLLRSLREPATLERLGLVGEKLLGGGDPARVLYSVTIYERGPHANRIRIQTDNLDQPLDINGGARIDLRLHRQAPHRDLLSRGDRRAPRPLRAPRARRAGRRAPAPEGPPGRVGARVPRGRARHRQESPGDAGGLARAQVLGEPGGDLLHRGRACTPSAISTARTTARS